ncbi:hypothetical protein AK830_g1784 [Neonectria ditissima]|uniref:Uncharacterized protein n=1 Tax=Neonectria ditissima TaxID=78410 RepID=A0A0P7B589_9HYPO|nr:hypothetical protein AK830_g1784 [Neonectria ditissima]
MKTMHWSRLDGNIPIGSTAWGFQGLRNVASEYNPAWRASMEKCKNYWDTQHLKIVKALVNALHDAEELQALWLIDYNIKGAQFGPTKAQAARPDAKIFFQDDRQFVEVVSHICWADSVGSPLRI